MAPSRAQSPRSPSPLPVHPDDADITQLLGRLSNGDQRAQDELIPLIYAQLHRMARGQMSRQRPDHTLGATALVNEAYLKIFQGEQPVWRDKDHFLALASTAMRQILVDHARGKNRDKRKSPGHAVPLVDELLASYEENSVDLLALDEALQGLAQVDPLAVQVVELRFFGGLQVKDVARVLDLSVRKVERTWQSARVWLNKEMS